MTSLNIIICFSIFLIACFFTGIYRKYAIKKSVIDIPNFRSSHSIPTPRGGGIAIVVSFYLGISFLYFYKLVEIKLYYALLSGLPLVIVGIIDDFRNVKPILRFSTQILSSILVVYIIGGIRQIDLGFYIISYQIVLVPLSIIGITWFINLFNFLDGIDAYASVEAIFLAISIYLFIGNIELLILVSATLGFLLWNWPNAKIFMGDVGSTLLGFILIVFGIYFNNTAQFNFIYWLILTSVFWFDASITLYRRWRNKEKLSEAHKKHAYQRIVQYGFSHKKTVLVSIIINLVLFGLTYLSVLYSKYVMAFFLLAVIILYIIVKLIDKKYPFMR